MGEKENIDIKDFFNKCNHFDWYYLYSKEHFIIDEGNRKRKELLRVAETSKILLKIYNAWHKHYFTGEFWGSRKAPKPKIEDYLI